MEAVVGFGRRGRRVTTFGGSGAGAVFTWNVSSMRRFFSPGRSSTFSSMARPSARSKRTLCSPGLSASAWASMVSETLPPSTMTLTSTVSFP